MNPLSEPKAKASVNLHDYRRAFLYKDLRALKFTAFIFSLLRKPWLVKVLTTTAGWVLRLKLPADFLFKKTIFRVFCAGETIDEAIATVKHLEQYRVKSVLDYVSEGENTPAAFERNRNIITANIARIAKDAPGNSVSVKLTGLEDAAFLERINLTDPEKMSAADRSRYDAFANRVDSICGAAKDHAVTIYIDAEDHCMQDLFDRIVELMMARYNRRTAIVYNTVQMYLRDRVDYVRRIISESAKAGYLPGIKLVRGAYVEKERAAAAARGIQSPVFDNKAATDESFDTALESCLSNAGRVYTCVASHNERSTLLAVHLINVHAINDHYEKVKFSQLYGMSDNLTFNLAARGFNASKYLPYGEVKKAIPYLIRRAEENSSISGQLPKELVCLQKEIRRRKQQLHMVFEEQ